MAQIRAFLKEVGKTGEWHPLAAEKVGNEFILKTISSGGGGVTLGVPKHYNGTANTAPATVTFAAATKSVFVENLDNSKDIFVSFDADANTFIIPSGETLSLDTVVNSLRISASVDGASYQILTTE